MQWLQYPSMNRGAAKYETFILTPTSHRPLQWYGGHDITAMCSDNTSCSCEQSWMTFEKGSFVIFEVKGTNIKKVSGVTGSLFVFRTISAVFQCILISTMLFGMTYFTWRKNPVYSKVKVISKITVNKFWFYNIHKNRVALILTIFDITCNVSLWRKTWFTHFLHAL